MLKFILWVGVVFVVLMGLRLINVSKASRRSRETAERAAPPPSAETMVRCARCGVYLPRADAKPAAGGLVCADGACARRA